MDEREEQRLIKEYLLGTLTEEEQQQIEQRVFTDARFKSTVLMVEDELVEDYVANSLSESERDRFTDHFLSTPAQIEKLRITAALHMYAADDTLTNTVEPLGKPHPVSARKGPLKAFFGERQAVVAVFSIAAALVLLIGAAIYFNVLRGQYNQRAVIEQEVVKLNNQIDPQTALPPGVATLNPKVLQVRLSPNLNRASGEMSRILVPGETQILQIRLPLAPEPYSSYQAKLSTVEGEEIFILTSLQPVLLDGTRVLVLNLPARILIGGDYLLKIQGIATDNSATDSVDYPFRIAR